MTATPIEVSFIVVNFNGGALLGDCLASLQAQRFERYEIIVVDNGSHDGSCDRAERDFPSVQFVRYAQNLGFAEANNRAVQIAKGEFVALVNNDATLDPEWTAHMICALRAAPEAGAAACRTLQARRRHLIDSAGFDFYSCASALAWKDAPAQGFDDGEHRPFGPVASAALYRRSALNTVGLFHPQYFCYYEDTDLAVRLVLFGFSTVYVPQAIAYHLGSQTGKDRSDFHVYHLRRNVEYLYWVDMVGHLAWLNLPFHLVYESLALVEGIRTGQFGLILKAKRDALTDHRWIREERVKLRACLKKQGRLREAKADLSRAARFGLPLWTRFREAKQRRNK